MKNVINRSHIEGYIYDHDLQMRESGPNSKNPGTKFIMGNVQIATDNDLTNVVPVHFTYVTATTAKGNPNATFTVLSQIIDETLGTVMKVGKESAGKLRIDSAIGLNEFYSERNGNVELVSAKRNEGGFCHVTQTLNEDETARNTFEVDMLITGVKRVEADEERMTPEKVLIRGNIFDFRKAILPVEFIATNPRAMDYFEDLNASEKNPTFTKLRGRQISSTVVRTITEEGAFGEPSIRETRSSRKDFVVIWAQGTPYVWDDEETITAIELQEAKANREIYLAGVKQRQDEYQASKNKATTPVAKGAFNF